MVDQNVRIEELERSMDSSNYLERIEAIKALRKIKSEKVLDILKEALKDDDDWVRKEAIGGLEEQGWKPQSSTDQCYYSIASYNWKELVDLGEIVVEPLVQMLKEKEFIKEQASRTLEKIGSLAIDHLTIALIEEEYKVQKEAAKLLDYFNWYPLSFEEKCGYYIAKNEWEKILALGPGVVKPLMKLLNDKSLEAQEYAIRYLGMVGNAAINPLIEQLKKEKISNQRQVERALAKIGPPATDMLVKTLKEERKEVKEQAAKILAKIGSPAVDPLIKLLKDKNKDVQELTAQTLVEIRAAAVKALIEILKDENKELRLAASDILGKIGSPAVKRLSEAMSKKDNKNQIEIIATLEKIADEQAINVLIDTLKVKESKIALEAGKALARIGFPAIEPLLLLLKDEDYKVRSMASRALKEFYTIVETKENIESEIISEPFIKALGAKEIWIQKEAIKALTKINGGKKALEALLAFRNNCDEQLLEEIEEAIRIVENRTIEQK